MAESVTATGAGMRDFLDWAAKKGELNASTANALRVAASKVLASEDDPDGVDVRSLSVDHCLERFENLSRAQYTSASMATYKTRFRNAVSMYLAWVDNDPTWKTVMKVRGVARSRKPPVPPAGPAAHDDQPLEGFTGGQPGHPRGNMAPTVTYQMPLRPDLLVQIQLPVDLTRADAERVAKFVESLAFDKPSHTGSANVPDASEGVED